MRQQRFSLRYPLFIILFSATLLSAFEQGDQQFWHAEKLALTLNEKHRLTLEQDFRSGNQDADLYYVHSDFGIQHKMSPVLAWSLHFREVFVDGSEGWFPEHRPYGQFVVKLPFGPFSTSTRARFEYRILPDERKVRNRDMITIKLRRSYTPLKLVPYMADEIFYSLKDQKLNRNRFYIGFAVKKFSRGTPVFYYMYQSSLKNGQWTGINVWGIKIGL